MFYTVMKIASNDEDGLNWCEAVMMVVPCGGTT
jgi:hypothetical protein